MMNAFSDRLIQAIRRKRSSACAGLDPHWNLLPGRAVRAAASASAAVRTIERFCLQVIEAVSPHVPVVKVQVAFFETWGSGGYAAYERVVKAAKRSGLLVIGDVKRGDIGSSSAAYAAAHLSGPASADAITVNPLFGTDGLKPFLDAAGREGRGIFILTRTSNPSAKELQDFPGGGRTLTGQIARLVRKWGDGLKGRGGYSSVGAVVGGTYAAEIRRLRRAMPRQFFLVPGLGAQGADDKAVRAAFNRDRLGALPSASRSVCFAFRSEQSQSARWQDAVERAARSFAAEWKY